MALYQLEHPKKLSEDDWKNLRGTALYEQMFRNRSLVTLTGDQQEVEFGEQNIENWLRDTCKSLYYIQSTGWNTLTVYIEGDPDVVHFKLAFHNEEYELPDEVQEKRREARSAAAAQQQAKAIFDKIRYDRQRKQEEEEKAKAAERDWLEDLYGKDMPDGTYEDWQDAIERAKEKHKAHNKGWSSISRARFSE